MAEPHVIAGLRDRRAEPAGMANRIRSGDVVVMARFAADSTQCCDTAFSGRTISQHRSCPTQPQRTAPGTPVADAT
jgi:hypothetical protein